MANNQRRQRYPLYQVVVMLFLTIVFANHAQAQLGTPPKVTVQPLGISVLTGGTAVISATSTSLTAAKFYWFRDGVPVSSTNALAANLSVPLVGTVSTLTINNVSDSDSGAYSLRITNAVGSTISSNAVLVVLTSVVTNAVSIVASGTAMTLNGFQMQLSAPAGSNVVVQASTNLQTWSPIATNANPNGTVTFLDTNAVEYGSRFYRAAIQ